MLKQSLVVFSLLVINVFCEKQFMGKDEAKEEDVIVQVTAGRVAGSRAYTSSQNKLYYAFRSIPFAEPPVGSRRFRPPIPTQSWDHIGILLAKDNGPMCLQPTIHGNSSEDCLTLNVFSPRVPNYESGPLLPVMVWIYGGFFLLGSAEQGQYGPDYFIDENIVIVTLNYRVGIFGFLSTGDEVAPGNYGLKDQILALKWVQENIRQFGGDPKNVTLFGESAGSASVAYLLQTPLTKGLYQKAIMQSGSSLCLWARTRDSVELAYSCAKTLGIITKNSTELVEELRDIDANALLLAGTSTDAIQTFFTNPRNGLLFAPSIEPVHAGAVITNLSHQMLLEGQFNQVPLIVGFNSAEGNPFEDALTHLKIYLLSYDLNPFKLIPIDMNVEENVLTKTMVALQIKIQYFGVLSAIALSTAKLAKFVTDDQFIRPITEYTRLVSRYTPTYFYKFSYEGYASIINRTTPGVGHAEELAYLFPPAKPNPNSTYSDTVTKERLISMWTCFAKTSDPTSCPNDAVGNVTWNRASSDSMQYLDIDSDLIMKKNPNKNDILFWKDLYKSYGFPPFDTY